MNKLKIKIYPNNKHQVIAIPINGKVADIFLDKLDKIVKEKYGKNIEDFIEGVSFYDDKVGRYKSFIPKVTSRDSEHNFDLISYNEDSFCINVFQVITKDFKEELYFEADIPKFDMDKTNDTI
jgi:hypothetical protein